MNYYTYFKNILKHDVQCMQTEINLFSVPWTRLCLRLKFNGVLENVLVSVQFSLKHAIVP